VNEVLLPFAEALRAAGVIVFLQRLPVGAVSEKLISANERPGSEAQEVTCATCHEHLPERRDLLLVESDQHCHEQNCHRQQCQTEVLIADQPAAVKPCANRQQHISGSKDDQDRMHIATFR
jgi:hypothetical protein